MSPKKATKSKVASAVSSKTASATKRGPRKKTASAEGTKGTVIVEKVQATKADDGSVILREQISVHAYYLSEDRRKKGLRADPVRDWLEAEKKVKGTS